METSSARGKNQHSRWFVRSVPVPRYRKLLERVSRPTEAEEIVKSDDLCRLQSFADYIAAWSLGTVSRAVETPAAQVAGMKELEKGI